MIAPLKQMLARVLAWFSASRHDRDFTDELAAHAAMLAEEHIRRGVPPAEAGRLASLELGGRAQLIEAHREARGLPFFDALLQDLRYAVRGLRREAGFTAFAVLIGGLGIGASSTIFSVLNALLLRPLPFSDPSRLVWIANDAPEGDLSGLTVPVGPFLDLREHSQAFSDIAAYYAFYGVGDFKLTGDGEPERLSGVPVSWNFFPLLGVQPQLGRLFTKEECNQNAPLVVLSAAFWRRRFASDPAIVGRTLTLNDRPFTVIGVMPASVDFGSIFAPGSRIDLIRTLPLTQAVNRQGNTLAMIGRLRPGVPVQQARAEAALLSEPIRVRHQRNELRFTAKPLEDHISGRLRPALFVLAGAVGVLMLIVCANLSNLQLSRTASRRKEIAVRVALGAGRGRLVRQMLTESAVLSCAGAVLGLGLAFAGTRLVSRLDAFSLPLLESVRVDAGVLGFTMMTAVLAGLLFGLAPALQVPASGVHDSLKEASRGSSEGSSHNWIRSALVVSEVAFACVLLAGAGLMIRSFLRVLDVDLGFRPDQAIAVRVDPGRRYSTQADRNGYFDELLRLARAVPGFESAGLTDVLPLGHNRSWSAGLKGVPYSRQSPPPDVFVRVVSDGYLAAMGIPLRAGRDFTEADNKSSKPVILINETLARRLLSGGNLLGRTVWTDIDREVVGVVGDVRHVALEQGSGGEVYLPIRQSNDYSSVDLVVRSPLPATAISPSLRYALRTVEPNLAAGEFRALRQLVDKAVSPRRFVVLLLAGFSAFALILASLGIYAVVSYSVNQRTQEIGIRMALGASAGELQRRILLRTLSLASAGMLAGTAAAWALTRAMSGMLFGVTAGDPVTFLGMLAILTAVAAAAGYLPARRASRIDPTVALRAN